MCEQEPCLGWPADEMGDPCATIPSPGLTYHRGQCLCFRRDMQDNYSKIYGKYDNIKVVLT